MQRCLSIDVQRVLNGAAPRYPVIQHTEYCLLNHATVLRWRQRTNGGQQMCPGFGDASSPQIQQNMVLQGHLLAFSDSNMAIRACFDKKSQSKPEGRVEDLHHPHGIS